MVAHDDAGQEAPSTSVPEGRIFGTTLRGDLEAFLTMRAARGAAADLLELAAAGTLTRSVVLDRVATLRSDESHALEEAALDAVLFVIERALVEGRLGAIQSEIRQLKRLFGVADGVFYTRRRQEVAQILADEMRLLLADRMIDAEEALLQVSLQEAFDLSYDEYRTLAQPAAERLIDALVAEIVADGRVSGPERERLERQLLALDTVYTLTPAQRLQLRRAGLAQ